MKFWYESKIVWAMIVQSLISILLLAQEWYTKGDFSIPGCIGLAVGVLVIVLRVWFTDQPTPQAAARADAKLAAQWDRAIGEADKLKAELYRDLQKREKQ